MADEVSQPVPSGKPSLRQRTTRGVMWVAAQAVATRGVTLVQQLALAWLLSKSDFGLIGLTYTVTTFVTLMANPGVDTVLVQRLRRFRHWATPAFWLGLAMGIAAAAIMLVLAPVAAWAYGQPKLIGLIAVLAIASPIQSLQIVPKAQLQMQMRFRAIVLLGLLQSVLIAVLTVGAAYVGMGAYSFVVPVPIAAAIVGAVNWRLARPPVRLEAEFSRWKYLFGNSAAVGGTKLLNNFTNQGDYIALGLAGFSDAQIGVYVFAFNIAIQPLRLVSGNVPVVLFPGLSHLALDPQKQVRAALRAMRLLTLVTVPFCLLQIVLTEPLFRLILPPRWMDSVLPCQMLTLGLMFNATAWPAASLMMAQGRFREYLWVNVIGALVFVVILGSVIWFCPGIVSVAAAVAVWHFLNSPYLHWAATRHHAPRGSYIAETIRPILAGVFAAIPCFILHANLPETVVGDVIAIVGGGLNFAAIYLLLIYILASAALHDLSDQLAPLWARLLRSKGAPPPDAASGDGVIV
jgi:PST family polysaccharide transporter